MDGVHLRPPAAVLLASTVLAVPFLAACTSGSAPAPTPSTSVVTSTVTPAPTATAPVVTGPTTAAAASSCPYATQEFVHSTMGLRLGKVTVLRSGGQVVGCRIYAKEHPDSQCPASCLAKEKLPGPNQPAVEITTQRYPSIVAAHNAFVLRAEAGTNPQQIAFGSVTGLCFQNDFDPQDKGTDFACTVNKGSTLVLVRTVDNTGTFSTKTLTTTVLRAVTA